MSQQARLRWTAVALAITLAAAIVIETRSSQPPADVVFTGMADVGGRFTLTDHTGRAFTERDLVGRSHVLYFGWSLDPDLTPAALQVVAAALARLPTSMLRPRLVFISLDPGRDDIGQLAHFIATFGEDTIAATGNSAAIAQLTQAYKLYFKPLPDASLPGGYSIDHASLFYVIAGNGVFQGAIPHTSSAAELAGELQRLLK